MTEQEKEQLKNLSSQVDKGKDIIYNLIAKIAKEETCGEHLTKEFEQFKLETTTFRRDLDKKIDEITTNLSNLNCSKQQEICSGRRDVLKARLDLHQVFIIAILTAMIGIFIKMNLENSLVKHIQKEVIENVK